ncbi:hypothetical protein L228DRAFT_265923 [Xylona heveae TC161]|uniref:Uncharacterized protein n=1 Tax=Xylona heveae (strain CBS 132557 / TC161) TaxID=1328760 RepID=A0A165IVW3_XYLHT|nr:hypothetical protein L228DRAFT_265923 [Xylona heveae TC161]KZF25454.1 hypothetical protein L228DRAFT_265923 [Xylona heveae TC161]
MTCDITNTPWATDQLPRYSRDPETSSILSEAPSYHTSMVLPPPPPFSVAVSSRNRTASTTATGLPSLDEVSAFSSRARNRGGRRASDFDGHTYAISPWSSTQTSHQAKHYHAVARRRAAANDSFSMVASAMSTVLNSANSQNAPGASAASNSAMPPDTSSPSSASLSPSSSSSDASSTNLIPSDESSTAASTPSADDELESWLEDPGLVGQEAADRARKQRLYIRSCREEQENCALRQENKSWDFMLGQMSDWQERQRSWAKFRDEVRGTRLLGRRLGLRK